MLRSSQASQTQYFQNAVDCYILGTHTFLVLDSKFILSTNDPNIPLNFSSEYSLNLMLTLQSPGHSCGEG